MNTKTPAHGLSIEFRKYDIHDGHVDYNILVKNTNLNQAWNTVSRFSALEKIHKKLVELNGDRALPDFPAKAYWGNLEPSFISKRQKGLEHYFMLVLQNGSLKNIKPLLEFLDSKNGKMISDQSTDKKATSSPPKDNNSAPGKEERTPANRQQAAVPTEKDRALEKIIEQLDKRFYDLQVTLNPPEEEEVRKRTSMYNALKIEMKQPSIHADFKVPKATQYNHSDLQSLLISTLTNVKTQFNHLPFLQNCKIVKEFDDGQ
eukprot:CAMPEP_0176421888 /NCGR_PEP_ID=MMETSP0127-20121128/9431_1 /TAXON_ID=938130 /ORGANISM="Platyophrya macrostoma, Strain WH" /LENGTH=259 /DNA_ID=CAMNT_0017802683 /DNA_START=55 /DNA_END=834 /DNA_ORIENTATION=+